MWFLYVIETRSGSYYTGVSTDVDRRFRQHLGELPGGARFFRSDPPELLLYVESHSDRSKAQKAESKFKSFNRKKKEAFIYSA